MSIITGQITDRDGAAIVVLVGVSGNRQRVLNKAGFPVPERVQVIAQLDTGSFVTAFAPEVYQSLGIDRFGTIQVRTPSTRRGEPSVCNQFDVSVTLVAGDRQVSFASVHAIASSDFDPAEEGVQAIIGRDILNRCVFNYYGTHKEFMVGF
jgi:hypothetical protein